MKSQHLLLGGVLLASIGHAHACLQPPIPGTIITSNFGMRFHPVHKTWRAHNGTDMRAAMFTTVRAAAAGQVTYSGVIGGGGNAVFILGQDGVQTRYLHLSKAGVKSGTMVNAGDVIALSGNTGESSAAPHLHFEARADGGVRPVDARSLLCQAMPEKGGAGPDATGGGQPAPQGPPAQGGGTVKFDSEPDFNGMANMSEHELLRSEVEKRFMNPDWHMIMNNCGTDYNQQQIDGKPVTPMSCEAFMRKEMSILRAMKNYLGMQIKASKERAQSILATRLIDQTKSSRAVYMGTLLHQAQQQGNSQQ